MGSPPEFSNLCSCEKNHLAVWGCVGYYHWYSQSSRLNTCIMITSHIQYTPIKLHSGYFNRCYDVLKMHTIYLILSPLEWYSRKIGHHSFIYWHITRSTPSHHWNQNCMISLGRYITSLLLCAVKLMVASPLHHRFFRQICVKFGIHNPDDQRLSPTNFEHNLTTLNFRFPLGARLAI